MEQVPLYPKELLELVLRQYRLPVNGVHGVNHWGRVLDNGRRLSVFTGADRAVTDAFAILHDSQRLVENRDPEHGPRAADFALRIRGDVPLSDSQFALLLLACRMHTRGVPADADITILTCLDADRLDIPRVGIDIRVELLFTAAARDEVILRWAADRAAGNSDPDVFQGEGGRGP
jgi:uncharacterized protein